MHGCKAPSSRDYFGGIGSKGGYDVQTYSIGKCGRNIILLELDFDIGTI